MVGRWLPRFDSRYRRMIMLRRPNFLVATLATALVLGLTMPVFADETKGTIRAVNTDRTELVLKGVVNDTTYILTKGAWISLDGRRCKLADLREGDKVNIDYEKAKTNQFVCSGVRAFRNATNTTGTIRRTDTNGNQLVLKGTLKDSVYIMDKNPTIYLNGKEHNFSDLRPEDSVDITYYRDGDRMMVTEVRSTRK